ncbi:aminotransferase class V-fold PLP-dependent enzyme [Bacillus rubiinfantis]|uniref:aminotransferase class V-fold PLP-dependent enzyme n=1 Tax=Bacillus rubiinfantis TaxID=1499680 RepID=UPI0005AA3173|nr:aminotransferase class V-fold PLP-dependent enzyme [Bacillus rubiinfantis]
MNKNHDYLFKIAVKDVEFDQIHHLNYQTFSEEIPQHEQNPNKKLVDQFHHENTYIICLRDNELVGMLAVRDIRPFSLDRKIGPVEESIPFKIYKPCEVRLLAVKKNFRNGRVFLGLVQFLVQYCLKKGYDIAFISGTVRQLKLYRQMGFEPFAEMTGSQDAPFQPMYLTKQTFEASLSGRILPLVNSFLPGPVHISENVRKALNSIPYSHRSEHFNVKLREVKEMLCQLTNCKYVQIMAGTGTLANDAVAAQLSLEKGNGLIIANGEFGSRLVEQAKRLGLSFEVLEKEWGQPYTKEEIKAWLSRDTAWIWAVHSETSTGMLNDISVLKELSKEAGVKLCLDCISSIGALPVDLSGVYLATGVSGKALRAFTGLSFVFHHHDIEPSSTIPKYLDLGTYMVKGSVPFSQSSNLVEALHTSLSEISQQSYTKIAETHQLIRESLKDLGFRLITDDDYSSPMIVTIELPPSIPVAEVGDLLYFNNYQLHYESSYLQERNWIQIACIHHYPTEVIETMIRLFYKITCLW